ncbi:MAG: hypothetical protein Q8O56_10400 [Solirubrobacteraceae bacterium]|nr:hypothetical protein [Solirubrobacteraceae bacterium]
MSADATNVLASIDALRERGRRRDRVVAARASALRAGRDPELAAAAASVEVRPPARLAGMAEAPGVGSDGHQHPFVRARVERIQKAMRAGRVTPAEAVRFYEAMSADEQAATKLLDAMPEGRVPLEPRAQVWGPHECGPPLPPNGMLPEGISLLSASQRAEVAARREVLP